MAKMKPYRCQNSVCSTDEAGRLISDFWAERPVCPRCKTDGKKFPTVIVELAVTHFDPPTHIPGIGQRIVACTGKKNSGQHPHMSGHPECVNCPECRATDTWKKAAEEWGVEELTPDSVDEIEMALESGKENLVALVPAVVPAMASGKDE